jgi:Asp/Glu/hydantoin racemase
MSVQKLAIIHTTPATIETMKALVAELIPECEQMHLMDDSILPELAQNGGQVEAIEERWFAYAKTAEQQGADCILSACSSVGEVAAAAGHHVQVPVLRIDEAMIEEAVRRGERIGVAATLRTTLDPTSRLLESKAVELGKKVQLEPLLVDEAYRLLMSGDKEGHDRVLGEELKLLAERTDVVVLAQASMARVVATLPEALQGKCLSSPRLGIERVKQVLEAKRS